MILEESLVGSPLVQVVWQRLQRGAREETDTVGDEVEAVAAANVVTYVRKLMHIYLYIYTEAGIVGDNEIEATAAAKRSRTDAISIHQYPHLYRYSFFFSLSA